MSLSVRVTTRISVAACLAAAVSLSALPAAAAATLDELADQAAQAWSGDIELLPEIYAPEGVHTATFYDRTNEYTGPVALERLAGLGEVEAVGPRIELPAPDGEWRWANFATLAGGTACLWHAVDGLIVRQDCILPERSTGYESPADLSDGSDTAAIDAIVARLKGTWGPGTSEELLATVYAPDAVHTARFLDETRRHVGPAEILGVARAPVVLESIGERVEFESSDGVLAWAQVNDLAGGSVCLFRALDGMIVRHDCLLPIAA